jgi:hypothetical protein
LWKTCVEKVVLRIFRLDKEKMTWGWKNYIKTNWLNYEDNHVKEDVVIGRCSSHWRF